MAKHFLIKLWLELGIILKNSLIMYGTMDKSGYKKREVKGAI